MGSPDPHESRDLDDAVAFRIHRTNRLLLTHLARVLDTNRHGLTAEKWFVLARLREAGEMRQAELADRSLDDAPNVSRLVERLVVDGLVERVTDPLDRRNRILRLSSDGVRRADELHERSVDERRLVFDGFSVDDLTQLTELLDRVEANVRRRLADDTPPTAGA